MPFRVHCHLLGQLTGDEKFTQFALADIFCFPSHYESEAFPCVLVEAMSFELPVVSTQWRGIQSIVDQQQTGILVPIKDAGAVANAIEELANDAQLMHDMGKRAREKFASQFTTERHIAEMEEMFQSVRNSTNPVIDGTSRTSPILGSVEIQ